MKMSAGIRRNISDILKSVKNPAFFINETSNNSCKFIGIEAKRTATER